MGTYAKRNRETLRVLLTVREFSVAEAIGAGFSNREIAEKLGIREQSIKNLTSRVMERLGCENRVQVALIVHGVLRLELQARLH